MIIHKNGSSLQQLSIERSYSQKKGVDRYEKARAHKQSLERDIGLRNERLAQLKEEATQLEPVKQSDIVY